MASPLLDFCKDSVASAPDLPPVGDDNPTKAPKRRRTAAHERGSEPKLVRGGRGKNGVAKGALVEDEVADVEEAAEEKPAEIAPNEAMCADAPFLGAAPGQEAEDEDYDACDDV